MIPSCSMVNKFGDTLGWEDECKSIRKYFINTLRPRQNGRHFADDIFRSIFLNENVWIPIKISLKFVPQGPINNIQALVQIMAWRRPGDKPLSGPLMVRLPTHICVTRPQWVKYEFISSFFLSSDLVHIELILNTLSLNTMADILPMAIWMHFCPLPTEFEGDIWMALSWMKIIIPPASTKLKGGYTGFTLSVCPSVDRIMSALYFQQDLSDPFHIYTSYQVIWKGVSLVMFVSKLKKKEILVNSLNL